MAAPARAAPAVRAVTARAAAIALAALLLAAGCGDDEREAASPAGSWTLAAGVDVDGWEAHAPTVTFEGGEVSGSTGCNRFGGPYEVDGEELTLGALFTTRMACGPPADDVERTFMAAMKRVRRFEVGGGELTLRDDQGDELLRFRAG